MQKAGFVAYSPYELGDKVKITLIEGMAITGYLKMVSTGTAFMTITDILAIHSLKNNQVSFLYELDGKKTMELTPWEELVKKN